MLLLSIVEFSIHDKIFILKPMSANLKSFDVFKLKFKSIKIKAESFLYRICFEFAEISKNQRSCCLVTDSSAWDNFKMKSY